MNPKRIELLIDRLETKAYLTSSIPLNRDQGIEICRSWLAQHKEIERLGAVLDECRTQLRNLQDHHCGGYCDHHGGPCDDLSCHARIMKSVNKACDQADVALRGQATCWLSPEHEPPGANGVHLRARKRLSKPVTREMFQ